MKRSKAARLIVVVSLAGVTLLVPWPTRTADGPPRLEQPVATSTAATATTPPGNPLVTPPPSTSQVQPGIPATIPPSTPTPPPPLPPPFVQLVYSPQVLLEDRETISEGIGRASRYLAAVVGTDRPQAITVRVDPGSADRCCRGSCCDAGAGFIHIDGGAGFIYIDPAHANWSSQDRLSKVKIAAHEYVHTWGGDRGCLGEFRVVWFVEGLAEYVAYQSLIQGGLRDPTDVYMQHVRNLRREVQQVPLSMQERRGAAGVNPTVVPSYLAVERAVSRAGLSAVLGLCEGVGAGKSWQEAFIEALGMRMEDFYADFEAYRKTLLTGS